MPLLGALFQTLFGGVIGGMAARVGQTVVDKAVVVAALVAATAALMAVFNNTVAPMVGAVFSTQYGQFLGLAFPPVSGSCMAAITAVWVGCNTYKLVERTVVVPS